jgi:hypothetical protein
MIYVKTTIFLVIGITIGYYIGYENAKGDRKNHSPAIVVSGEKGALDNQRNMTVAETRETGRVPPNGSGGKELNPDQLVIYTKMSILAFAEAVKSPENSKAFRAKFIREFSNSHVAFFRNTNLTNEQKRGMLELLADRHFEKMDITAVAYDDPGNRYHLSKEIDAAFDASVNMLLDAENANLYRDFTANTRAWKALDQFISRLDESCPPLDSEQKAQLLEVLKQDGKARSAAELDHVNLPFLSKEQIKYYEAYMENENLVKNATNIEKLLRKADADLRQELLIKQNKAESNP